MSEFERLKNKYSQLLLQAWYENKETLIESFIEYYGEEYRDIIVSKINEIVFVYYVPISQLSFLDSFMTSLKETDKKDYLEYRDACLKANISSVVDQNLIQITDSSVSTITNIEKILTRIASSFFVNHQFGVCRRFVCLPIFIIGENSIIHEINHAITYETLALLMDENTIVDDISKHGIVTDHIEKENGSWKITSGSEKLLEELINEKSAMEITEIFHRRGGKLLYFNTIPLQSAYTNNLYLIEDFYSDFKELLKRSRITENKNLLIQNLGKENYEQFLLCINQYYSSGSTVEEQRKQLEKNKQHYSEIQKLVFLMRENVLPKENGEYFQKNDLRLEAMQLCEMHKKTK